MKEQNNENLKVSINQEEIDQAIKLLKNSDQTLIFLESIVCPVREYIGKSNLDLKMKALAEELKQRAVIHSYSGYSAGNFPFHLYITSFTLTKEFFDNHKKPSYKQLEMLL